MLGGEGGRRRLFVKERLDSLPKKKKNLTTITTMTPEKTSKKSIFLVTFLVFWVLAFVFETSHKPVHEVGSQINPSKIIEQGEFLQDSKQIVRIHLSQENQQKHLQPSSPQSESQVQWISQGNLMTSPTTIVTGYFTLKSKFEKQDYLKWMSNMLSVQDAMVIFTSQEMLPTIQSFRSHATNRTVVVPLPLEQVELAQTYSDRFWQDQLDKDPEKKIHRSYQLFWIWLSKSFLVKTAIDRNIFQSDVFLWSDIGCFRNGRYNHKTIFLHLEQIPKDKILQMAHHDPNPPPYVWWNDKYSQSAYFYHSGSQMVGYKDTWIRFHEEFLKTIQGFVERDMFIGEDQTVLQSTCLRVPSLCAYVPYRQVADNHYFGLRHVLHVGGHYDYWYPPEQGILPLDKDKVKDPALLQRKMAGRVERTSKNTA